MHGGVDERDPVSWSQPQDSIDHFVEQASGIDLERRRIEVRSLEAGDGVQVPCVHDLDAVTGSCEVECPLQR